MQTGVTHLGINDKFSPLVASSLLCTANAFIFNVLVHLRRAGPAQEGCVLVYVLLDMGSAGSGSIGKAKMNRLVFCVVCCSERDGR